MKRLNLVPLYFLALLCELKCARVYNMQSQNITVEAHVDQNIINPNAENLQKNQEKPSFVYLLLSSDNATYVGATIDLEHRLRQLFVF